MEYIKTTLGEISIGKGQYGIGASAIEYSPDLYNYLRITDINDDGTLNIIDLKSVDDPKAREYLLSPNDIVFARTGNSTGRNYFYDGSDGEFVYAGFLIKFSLDPSKVNPRYIKYYCLSDEYKGWVQGHSTGSTRGNINAKTYAGMEISLPPREQQDNLVKILDNLEAKRKTNSAINRNLEDQIASVFEELRNSVETRTVKVGDLTLTSNTGADAIQKAPIVEEDTGIRCVRVGDMTNNRPVHEWGFSKVEPDVFIQYQLHKDDIVVTRTATLGINRLITEDLKAVYNNGLIRISLDKTKANPLFVYRQLQLKDFENYIARINGESSTRPNMKMNYFLSYEFELPSIDEQSRIVDQITESYKLQQKLVVENMELAAIRDTLLPSLMSGELDVSELDI